MCDGNPHDTHERPRKALGLARAQLAWDALPDLALDCVLAHVLAEWCPPAESDDEALLRYTYTFRERFTRGAVRAVRLPSPALAGWVGGTESGRGGSGGERQP